MRNLIVFVLLIYSSLSYSQKTVELITFDCNSDNSSMLDIKELKFKILTEHQIKTDTTSKYWYQFEFKSLSDKVKIRYENIYKQEIDTTFTIQENNEQLFLCIDKFKNYETETLIQKAIKNKKRWNLNMTVMHCFGIDNSELEIIPKKSKLIAKYTYWKYPENSNRKKKFVKKVKIHEKQIKHIETFEKQMKLMNRPNGGCTAQSYYNLKVGDEEIEIEESSCSGFDETELLTKLGIK